MEETSGTLIANARAVSDRFVWSEVRSPEHLGRVGLAAMDRFLADFPPGITQDRYRTGGLPRLPSEDVALDLALCSRFQFLYSDRLTLNFHVAAIEKMCRVVRGARTFALLGAYGAPSSHVGDLARNDATPARSRAWQDG